MGREIRRVPPNWQHPKSEKGHYKPMYDASFDDKLNEWVENNNLWKAGKHPDQLKYPDETNCEYWQWSGGPPDPEYYRPEFKQDPTWYQVYETVSEGTPLTPPFETKEQLLNHLITIGTDYEEPWSRKAAESFIKHEWAPSMIISDGKIHKSNEIVL